MDCEKIRRSRLSRQFSLLFKIFPGILKDQNSMPRNRPEGRVEESCGFFSCLILSGFDKRDFSNPSASFYIMKHPAAASITGFPGLALAPPCLEEPDGSSRVSFLQNEAPRRGPEAGRAHSFSKTLNELDHLSIANRSPEKIFQSTPHPPLAIFQSRSDRSAGSFTSEKEKSSKVLP
jgi:hypothetical protein